MEVMLPIILSLSGSSSGNKRRDLFSESGEGFTLPVFMKYGRFSGITKFELCNSKCVLFVSAEGGILLNHLRREVMLCEEGMYLVSPLASVESNKKLN